MGLTRRQKIKKLLLNTPKEIRETFALDCAFMALDVGADYAANAACLAAESGSLDLMISLYQCHDVVFNNTIYRQKMSTFQLDSLTYLLQYYDKKEWI